MSSLGGVKVALKLGPNGLNIFQAFVLISGGVEVA